MSAPPLQSLAPLWSVALADFRERTRTSGFLVTLAGAAGCGYLVHTGNISLAWGGVRGAQGSAWLGTLMAVVLTSFLSLAGFYLTKNALERDRRTGVGEILAATPLSPLAWIYGKAASNFLVLAAIVGLLAAAGVAIQLLSGEDRRLDVVAFVVPIALLALPVVALTAAAAVLFESIRFLRGAFGNAVYFFAWVTSLTLSMLTPLDVTGLKQVESSLSTAFATAAGAGAGGIVLSVGPQRALATAPYPGIEWTAAAVGGRLVWLLAALALTGLAVLCFRRFDPEKEGHRKAPRKEKEARPRPARLRFRLPTPRAPFPALVAAELRLALRGLHPTALLIAAGLVVAGLVVPLDGVRKVVLPLAWIWPLAVWSPLGTREARHGTAALVASGPRPVWFHAAALQLSGVLIAALAGAGVLIRLLLAGDAEGLLAWTAGCLFIPALAFALGAWTGGGRAFEILYLLLWYLGPINHTPALDYLGATLAGPRQGVPLVFLALAVGLFAAAVVGRGRRLVR
jgi:hypothetical protein